MCFACQDGSAKMLDKDGNPLTVKVKDVLFKCVSRGNMWCKMYFLMLPTVVTALRYKSSMG